MVQTFVHYIYCIYSCSLLYTLYPIIYVISQTIDALFAHLNVCCILILSLSLVLFIIAYLIMKIIIVPAQIMRNSRIILFKIIYVLDCNYRHSDLLVYSCKDGNRFYSMINCFLHLLIYSQIYLNFISSLSHQNDAFYYPVIYLMNAASIEFIGKSNLSFVIMSYLMIIISFMTRSFIDLIFNAIYFISNFVLIKYGIQLNSKDILIPLNHY